MFSNFFIILRCNKPSTRMSHLASFKEKWRCFIRNLINKKLRGNKVNSIWRKPIEDLACKLSKSLVQSGFSEVYGLLKSGRMQRQIHYHIYHVFAPKNLLLREQHFFIKYKTTYFLYKLITRDGHNVSSEIFQISSTQSLVKLWTGSYRSCLVQSQF